MCQFWPAVSRFCEAVGRFCEDEGGQDLIEYCLLLAFVALCAVGLLTGMRTSIMGLWSATNTALVSATSAAS